jgi:hypothetical protein
MTMPNQPPNDDMPAEIDFTGGQRGKFYQANAIVRLPVYLDPQVRDYLAERAQRKGIEVDQFINELLQHDIQIIEAAR